MMGLVEVDFIRVIASLVRKMIPMGKCSAEAVAQQLWCDKRTLQRKLKARNTSFQAIVDAVRFELASTFLTDTDLSLTQLTEMVGYRDLSTFSAAFKKRFGQSPTTWRKTCR